MMATTASSTKSTRPMFDMEIPHLCWCGALITTFRLLDMSDGQRERVKKAVAAHRKTHKENKA